MSRFLSLFTLPCLVLFVIVTADDKYFAIKNQDTGLALDGKEESVKTRRFSNSDTQLWKMVPSNSNRNVIVNKANGYFFGWRSVANSDSSIFLCFEN